MTIEKIISGGQTGVDRAALDAAHACGIPRGGWCPKGRRAEDGSIDTCYPLKETPSAEYAQRTAWNVRDGDGTLIVLPGAVPTGGTALTVKEAEQRGKPLHMVHLSAADPEVVSAWIAQEGICTLNVAGPRESEAPGVYAAARVFLEALLAGKGEQGNG